MTIYNAHNSLGASVHDIDTLERLHGVISVDDREGIVTRHVWPVRLDHTGEVDRYETRYRAIHPIFGGSPWPVMFHCYGRMN